MRTILRCISISNDPQSIVHQLMHSAIIAPSSQHPAHSSYNIEIRLSIEDIGRLSFSLMLR